MMKKDESIKIADIIEIILKYRWFIIVPLCIAIVTGIYLIDVLPRIYQANVLILVQPQEVPSDYVKSIVSSNINARLNAITKQLLSRTSLEQIIKDMDLFKDAKYQDMLMTKKTALLRQNIKISLSQTRRITGAFTISFKGEDPLMVMKTANLLGDHFIDENLKTREAQAMGTTDFLDDELDNIRNQLELVEERHRLYRKKHMGSLPEQLEANLRFLDRLQEQLLIKQQLLSDTKKRFIDLKNRKITSQNNDPTMDINHLKRKLAELKIKYTDNHPDIFRLKKMIKEVEAANQQKITEPDNGLTPEISEEENIDFTNTQEYTDLKLEIEELSLDIAGIADRIKNYQQRVEDTPKRELELMSLRRDYQDVKETYHSILKRKLESEISVNMERKQKGEQFKIIDSAKLPETPVSPDMKKLFLFTIACGLGVGGAIIFLLEFLNTSFRRIEEIEQYLEVPLLCTIPTIHHKTEMQKITINNILTILGFIITLTLIAYFSFLTLL